VSKDLKIRVRGRSWNLQFVRVPNDADGICDAYDTPGKRIRISPSLKGERKLEVIVHEVLHASHWDMAEEAVEETARDVARVLWRLGWREA